MKLKSVVLLLVGVLIGLQLVAQAVLAKGPPQKVTISGADLAEEIVITDDETTLNALAMMTLEDYRTRTDEAPDVEGEGYLITRYFENSAGRLFPFDALHYFPDPQGGRGYINYTGIFSGSSEYDGDWFRANSDSETVLLALIEGEDVERAAERKGMFDRFIQVIAQFMAAQ